MLQRKAEKSKHARGSFAMGNVQVSHPSSTHICERSVAPHVNKPPAPLAISRVPLCPLQGRVHASTRVRLNLLLPADWQIVITGSASVQDTAWRVDSQSHARHTFAPKDTVSAAGAFCWAIGGLELELGQGRSTAGGNDPGGGLRPLLLLHVFCVLSSHALRMTQAQEQSVPPPVLRNSPCSYSRCLQVLRGQQSSEWPEAGRAESTCLGRHGMGLRGLRAS